MTKKEIRLQLIFITLMDEAELNEFQMKLSMSDISGKDREFMQKAIDLKQEYFKEANNLGAMVEISEAPELD